MTLKNEPKTQSKPSLLPLDGIRVLDLSWLLPGPFSTMLLGDLGADVIKVERPEGGDYLRDLMPDMFNLINKGKRSITADLKDPKSRDQFLKLAATADIFLEGFRPGVAEKLGVGYAQLCELKPDIIYVSISGYGQTGPYANRPGHDVNYLATSGALSIPGSWNEPPHRSGLPVADLSAALYAALNIVSAVRRRDLTGEGAYLDISLTDAALHWTKVRAAGEQNSTGTWHHVHPGNDVFATSDGSKISIALIEPKFFANFCGVVDRPDLLAHFAHPEKIADDPKAAMALRAALSEIFRSQPLSHWSHLLSQADVPFAPVNDFAAVAQDPHFASRGIANLTSMSVPGGLGGNYAAGKVPDFGQHSEQVFAEVSAAWEKAKK